MKRFKQNAIAILYLIGAALLVIGVLAVNLAWERMKYKIIRGY